MSETVLEYMTRVGINPDSTHADITARRLLLNGQPVTDPDAPKQPDDVVVVGLD